MKLPTTRRVCAKLYRYRRFHNRELTKLDMYLGGMICCSEEEFLYRKPTPSGCVIRGFPCICNYHKQDEKQLTCTANGPRARRKRQSTICFWADWFVAVMQSLSFIPVFAMVAAFARAVYAFTRR